MNRVLAMASAGFLWPALAFAAADTPAASPNILEAEPVLNVPVSPIIPGDPPAPPKPANPLADDPAAVQRGMQDFISFNCVGCHAPNGGGGMGPSLSDRRWLHGSDPANVFLSIFQGRSNGMPAWGKVLPVSTIWDLVAYVEHISEKPGKHVGRTISRTPPNPNNQQTPTEFLRTTDPWSHMQEFTAGQKPKGP
jgi:cytochrome c oxidase cbb3-type subunit 3